MSWPVVTANDHGIRPAGRPDTCFYCRQTVGNPHEKDCVTVTKKVRVKVTTEIEISVPHGWDRGMIDFRYNESTWCADNLASLVAEHVKHRDENGGGCLCGCTKVEFLEVTDDTPGRSGE